MKLKMLNPEQILTIIVAMIVFGVGIYAVFATNAGIVTGNYAAQPGTPADMLSGQGQLGTTTGALLSNNNSQPRYVPCPLIYSGWFNSTGVQVTKVEANAKANAGSYSAGWNTQTTPNGTIMPNMTYRIPAGSFKGHNNSYRITYIYVDPIDVNEYTSMQNITSVSNNVFNIVGICLIVGAIMLIVGIVYSYIRPGGGIGFGGGKFPGM